MAARCGRWFFGDLTKKLVSSAGEKAASAIDAKAGEALGNKLFNRQKKKPKIPEGEAAPAVDIMNGDFRSDQYLNRTEYYAYDLETDISTTVRGNNQEQMKNQHRFIIDNTAEINPIDWYNAFFEVEFKLVKLQ